MRHDEERPRSSRFVAEAAVPGHWTQVLAEMRANVFTHLTLEEVRAEAVHVLVVAPSPDVARACFGELLEGFTSRSDERADVEAAGSVAGADADVPSVEVIGLEELVPARVPAGTWVFLPHRQDGWTELEEASERLRRALVKENSDREADERLTLIEFGINMWLWAEPPSSGGDPVCHAGELISWESAWALGPADGCDPGAAGDSASARPPIYFGLPPVLRKRRWDG
ncbi:hypothetical protein [Brevibacterium renqingii]|uniref:hypothetical protein n=1 Tax=Brevibacterium renqingii TaxID=2776916 RepID=UPI001ADF256C|nr:hypothetical protein [Brevibacterium renqingii]